MSFFKSNAAKQNQAPEPPAESAAVEPCGGDASGKRAHDAIKADIIGAMKTVYDPEIPVDIYELGLIYGVDISDDGVVSITMTLTTPMCPAAEILPPEVEAKTRMVEGVTDVDLELVWDPPWSMDMMSEAARLELNL